MHIRSTQPGPEPRDAHDALQRAVVAASRALARAARAERLDQARAKGAEDALELSAATVIEQAPDRAERDSRVSDLAEAHRLDRLHTPERIERAVHNLLGDA